MRKIAAVIIILALLGTAIVFLTGCGPHRKKTITVEIGEARTNEYVIEGCHYIGRLDAVDKRASFLTHKGNCPNPIHKENGTDK
jgi:hypothetical protein